MTDEPAEGSVPGIDDASYQTDLEYAASEWGLKAEEWQRICVSLGKIGIGPQARKAYVADLLAIIEAGFDAYFAGLGKHSQPKEQGREHKRDQERDQETDQKRDQENPQRREHP